MYIYYIHIYIYIYIYKLVWGDSWHTQGGESWHIGCTNSTEVTSITYICSQKDKHCALPTYVPG